VTAIMFLLIPVVIVASFWAAQAVRHRKPTGTNSSIEAFRREMRALAPDADEEQLGG